MPDFKNKEEYEKWKEERAKNIENLKDKNIVLQEVDKTNQIIKISVAIGILIISLSLGYYFAIYIPDKNYQEQLYREQKEQEAQKQKGIRQQQEEEKREIRKRQESLQRELDKENRMIRESDVEEQKEDVLRAQREERERAEDLRLQKAEEEAEEKWDEDELRRVRAKSLTNCMNEAYEAYIERWESTCKKIDLSRDCLLPSETSKTYSEDRQRHIDNCYKLYGN